MNFGDVLAADDCVDSTTYIDPFWGDTCVGWASYKCTGYSEFSDEEEAELLENCPVACEICDAGSSSSGTFMFNQNIKKWVCFCGTL